MLTFLFGPFGLFYTGAGAAIVMLGISLVVAVVTLGLGLIFIWPVSMVWGAVSASNQHGDYLRWLAQMRPPHPVPPPPPRPLPPDQPWA